MDFEFLLTLSTLIGLFSLLKTLVVILRWVWGSFLRPQRDLKKYGSWAVVTGPTDGIGKATTFHLAREGLNLVLVGRSPAKLSSVSSEVRERFAGVEVRSIVCDFAKDLENGIKRIEQGIKDLDVGILINNVGTTYPFAMFLHELDEKLIERVIGVNVMGTTKVTHVVLQGMVERRRGAIVNIGSGSSSYTLQPKVLKESKMEFRFLLTLSTLIGLLSLFKALVAILRWVWASFLRPKKDLRKYGSWAVVTGPTDGIGKAMAFGLAGEGLNLVLVGRNPAKLISVSSEIRQRFAGIEIKSVVCDFAEDSDDVVEKIERGIKDLDVGILINNVGTTYPHAMFLHELEEAVIERVIGINVVVTTKVTHVVLQGMVKRRRGAIVNIGSSSALDLPSFPLFTIYAATKVYIEKFSRSLSVEYKPYGIDVQCQVPLYVSTKMTNIRPSFFAPSADEYAGWCLRWVGHDAVCVPYWTHSIQSLAARFLPDAFLDWWFFRYFLVLREKAMKQQRLYSKEFLLALSTLIGLCSLFKALVAFLRWVWASFLRPKKDLRKYGPWAVVTGPTDGIGKAMAFSLASEGLNLVLVGRNPAKLSSVSSEIRQRFAGVQIKSVVCDFAEDADDVVERVEQGIKDLDVGVLINNVGTTNPHPLFSHELDQKMIETYRNQCGGDNKGDSCGASRNGEEEEGSHRQHWVPFFVSTKMTKIKPSLFAPTADQYAGWCLRWVGHDAVCVPYWTHSVQSLAARFLPDALIDWWFRRYFVVVREKVMKKRLSSKES
ncbi:Testosterone 17-beta-dehydrogenase 3 [Nymphaea thermarum]|nr:Testosterone 17-beta-dehydrogenase 3 [Nymphaea thermarum]